MADLGGEIRIAKRIFLLNKMFEILYFVISDSDI